MAIVDKTQWEVIGPLLDKLLDAGPEERAAQLAELRRTDPRLAAELDSLLANERAIDRDAFLEGSALPAETTLVGKVVGSYTIDRLLAQGGMGSVWLAHRSDGRFEGQAAVKFLNLALIGRGGAERFQREGQVLAKLVHPSIARLIDAGVADGGQPYLILEYVDGEPIDRWCETHALDLESRVRLFIEVLRAVEYAHGNLILHRDLKPANILITGDGRVKLLDFGIAKLLDDRTHGAQPTELTQLAGRAFTPEYAAPEQIRGEDVTTATDVYALGVLLYRLLSGDHPTARASAPPVEQLRAVLETVPVRLSVAAANATHVATTHGRTVVLPARALRGDLDNIASKALKKSPLERYSTVAAFADDLNRYLNNEPVSARPDSRRYRITKFVQRHRLGVGAASATLLALIAGVIGTTWQAIEARRERDAAIFQAERALAKGNLVNLMLGAIGDADRPLTQREILERSVTLIEKQFMHDPRIAIDLLLPIAGQYLSLGDTAREYAVMQRAGAIAAASGDPALISSVACNTVETELMRGRIDLAQAQLAAGQTALAQLASPAFGLEIACMQAGADVARSQGDYDLAIARISEAIDRSERTARTRGNTYPKLLSFLAAVQMQSGDLRASYNTQKKLQQLDERLGRSETVDYLSSRRNEAVLLMAFGEYLEAQSIIESIVKRWSAVSGDASAPAWWISQARGILMHRLGNLQAAERDLSVAAERSRAQGNVEHVFGMDLARARVLIDLGRLDEADKLLALLEAAGSTRLVRSLLFTTATVRAELLLAKRALPQAAQAIEAEIAATGFPAAKQSAALAAALRAAARVQVASGNAAAAQRRASEAVTVSERVARDPSKSADVGESLLLLAQSERLAGETASSVTTARRAARSLAAGLGDEHPLTRDARVLAGL